LNRELKLKLANTTVGPFPFDYTGKRYFEMATSTLHNSGACIYLPIDWPARKPVILVTFINQLMHSIIRVIDVKILLYKSLKDPH